MSEFFYEQLKAARQTISEQPLLPMSLANGQYITISNEIPAGMPTYEFKSTTRAGQAAVIMVSDTAVPVVDEFVDSRIVKVYPIRLAARMTQDELDTSEALGINRLARKLQTVREGIDRELDIIAYVGQPGTTLQGLANNANVTMIVPPADGNQNGATNSPDWVNKTPAQILRDLNTIALKVSEQNALLQSVNRLLMPVSKLQLIQSIPYNASTGDNILTVFRRNQAELPGGGVTDIVGHPALEAMGVGGKGLIIAYNTAGSNRLHIPQRGDFRDLTPTVIGTEYRVPCQMRTAGVEIEKTLEVVYATVG